FGYSDGAVVALMVALARPDLVRRLILTAGVYHHDGWAAGIFDGEAPEVFRDSYGEVSPDGAGHFDAVVAKLAAMHAREPAVTPGELGTIPCRTLVMIGDDDEVRLEHAVELYRSLPDGELAVVPGTSHGLLVEKPDLCHLLITDFLTSDPVETFAPIRRAQHP
ncbi:MAG TPA: alpha/beta hydrolase, partial [Streptosporangiaceae bacterium]